jgi:hypothetical protein
MDAESSATRGNDTSGTLILELPAIEFATSDRCSGSARGDSRFKLNLLKAFRKGELIA